MALWKLKPVLDPNANPIWVGPSASAKRDGIWIGVSSELGSGGQPQVWLSTAKEQVIAIVGKRGSGKSFTLGVLCEGLTCKDPPKQVCIGGNRGRAVLLFDPLDIYWTTRLSVTASSNSEAQKHFLLAKNAGLQNLHCEVEAWVPGSQNQRDTDPSWFRLLQIPVSALGLEEWQLLLNVDVMGEPMGHAIAEAIALVTRHGFNRGGTFVPATPRFGIPQLQEALDSHELAGSYHAETLRALRQRLGSLEATGLFHIDGTPLSSLLRPGGLTVILLQRLPQSYREAVVAVLTRGVTDARARAAFIEKRLALDNSLTDAERELLTAHPSREIPRVMIALDEAQTILAPGAGGPAKGVFVQLVKEGRNLGLSAALATQQPSAIDQKILSQVETFIAHQLVTEADIRAVRENLKSVLPEAIQFGKTDLDFGGLLRDLDAGQCVVSAADSNLLLNRTFVISVRPRATVHGGIEL
jgi:hypothetical protein